jgi:hypothetical protein
MDRNRTQTPAFLSGNHQLLANQSSWQPTALLSVWSHVPFTVLANLVRLLFTLLLPCTLLDRLLSAASTYLTLLIALTLVPSAVLRDFSLHAAVATFAARLHLNLLLYCLSAVRLLFVIGYLTLICLYSTGRGSPGVTSGLPPNSPPTSAGVTGTAVHPSSLIWTRFGCSLLSFVIHAFGCCILYLGQAQKLVQKAEKRLANRR